MVTPPARMPIPDESLAQFRGAFYGDVILPDDEGYDEARTVWNATIDRRPRIIARCSGTADVVRAVNFAREHELLVAVRGGGHNIAGSAVCDGGIVIDLSKLRSVHVDPDAKTARVAGGATWRDVDHETQAFGLAVPGGLVSSTGVAGLTLGGGFGWLSRKYGLTCDNVRSVDLVTADGEFVRASADSNEGLFWGLRGGGGNFGVATSFEFDLHEVGPEVLAGMVFYPMDDAVEGLRTFREFVADAPNEAFAAAGLRLAPPAPFLPAAVHGEPVLAFVAFYEGDPARGEEVLAPLRTVSEPIADVIIRRQYQQFQQIQDPANPPGGRNYWKSHNLETLGDDAIETLVEQARSITSPESAVAVYGFGESAVSDVAPAATAYPHRDVPYVTNIVARWKEATEDDRHIGWARETFEAMTPYSTGGVYVNFLGRDEDRVRAAFGDNYDRLAELKAEWDPDNLFRVNQNVEPSR